MKKVIIKAAFIAAAAFSLASFTGCKEKETPGSEYAKPIDLAVSIANKNLVMGESVDVTISAANEGETLNEDLVISLTAVENNADVSSTLFEEFPASVTMSKGESEMTFSIPVVSEGVTGSHTVIFTASSRGYTFTGDNGARLTIGDYRYISVSIKNNTSNEVREGDKFVLVASLGVEAAKDITVTVNVAEGDEVFFENMPATLVIQEGASSVESPEITMAHVSSGEKSEITLTFTSSEESSPVANNGNLVIKRQDTDEPLGDLLTDERHVYEDPAQMLVSADNEAALKEWNGSDYKVIKVGDAHPNPALSTYTFVNASEFHRIQACISNADMTPNANGNLVPAGFWDQNTKDTQKYVAVNNGKYSNVTEDGYLRMWAAKETELTTGEFAGRNREYGYSAFYAQKFSNEQVAWNENAPMNTRIEPGIRVEARIRVRGEVHGFNPAFWFMGNSNRDSKSNTVLNSLINWPQCGEIDVLENPANKNSGIDYMWQTVHTGMTGNGAVGGYDHMDTSEFMADYSLNSGQRTVDMSEWNIFWFEWSADGNTIRMGTNGMTTRTVTRSEVEATQGGVWPFDLKYNAAGLHLLLTLGAPSTWSMNTGWTNGSDPDFSDYQVPPAGWDSGWANISYEESKTSEATPRMEIDWIRYYAENGYQGLDKQHSSQLLY